MNIMRVMFVLRWKKINFYLKYKSVSENVSRILTFLRETNAKTCLTFVSWRPFSYQTAFQINPTQLCTLAECSRPNRHAKQVGRRVGTMALRSKIKICMYLCKSCSCGLSPVLLVLLLFNTDITLYQQNSWVFYKKCSEKESKGMPRRLLGKTTMMIVIIIPYRHAKARLSTKELLYFFHPPPTIHFSMVFYNIYVY